MLKGKTNDILVDTVRKLDHSNGRKIARMTVILSKVKQNVCDRHKAELVKQVGRKCIFRGK